MAFSIDTKTGDGVTTQFTISFPLGFLDRADVKCRVNKEVDGLGAPVYRTITWISDTFVQIGGAVPANGVLIEFIRTVSKTTLVHNYSDGVEIQETNLDDSNKQTLMAVQEVLDGRLESGLATDFNAANHKIINLANGTDPQDAVNFQQLSDMTGNAPAYAAAAAASASAALASKNAAATSETNAATSATNAEISNQAAQAAAAGIKWRNSCKAYTQTSLGGTYSNGASGVGATITASANGVFPAQDGVTLSVGDRLCVNNQTPSSRNGIYVLTNAGSAGSQWVLTRATDMDAWSEIVSAAVLIEQGTVYGDKMFICVADQGGTVGSSGIGFSNISTGITALSITGGLIADNTLTESKLDSAIKTAWQKVTYNSQSANYTLALTDAGQAISHPSADTTARTITIPANATVAFPRGTFIMINNMNAAGALTLAITTDTLRWAGSGLTGSRTIAANGYAIIWKEDSDTEWKVNGVGIS